jgi:TLC domain
LFFGILNISSPLLHLSKLASKLEFARLKLGLFAAFTVVFFVTRLLVFPYVVMKRCADTRCSGRGSGSDNDGDSGSGGVLHRESKDTRAGTYFDFLLLKPTTSNPNTPPPHS